MKKIMMMALMAIVATTAFAGDSEALKKILKAKTYAEAEAEIKSNFNQLASPAEKAKAYNKLVELTIPDDFEKAKVEAQLKGGNLEQLYTDLLNGFNAAEECDKYDIMPDAKGKVKPAFHKKRVDKLIGLRGQLVDGAQFFSDQENYKMAFTLLEKYVETYDSPLFAADLAKTGDPNYERMAMYASRFALQVNDCENVKKYAKIALNSSEEEVVKEAIIYKDEAIRKSELNTKQDTINFINVLKADLEKCPKNDYVLEQLFSNLLSIGQVDEAGQIINNTLASDPNNFVGWVYKGSMEFDQNKFQEAAESLAKALTIRDNSASVWYLRGKALIAKAEEVSDTVTKGNRQMVPGAAKQILPFYEEAKKCLERAKELDPDQIDTKWKYLLEENCVYNIETLTRIANQ